jgi:DNA-binding NarL/FixJ family response regulator
VPCPSRTRADFPASWDATAAPANHAGGETKIMRLLIVDDNAHFLEAARDLLEREGMTVVAVASTSAEALRCAAEFELDVTLVDVDLGDESGLDLARHLAAAARRSPVILISANAEQDLVDLVDDSPAIGFVSKSDLSGQAIAELIAGRPNGRRDGST